MGMPDALEEWTAEAVRALPADGKRHEAIDGALLVTPAPSRAHQYAVAALYERLAPYVHGNGLGVVTLSPSEIELDPRTLVQPDLFVARLVQGRRPRERRQTAVPLLVIEVLSPSTAHDDLHRKRRRYQRAGVAVYWIVDLDDRLVQRWRPDDERAEILTESLDWQPDPARAGLSIGLPEIFAEACDR